MQMPPGSAMLSSRAAMFNAVSKDVMGFDDYVADVNADAKCDTHVFRIIHCKFADTLLELHRGPNCLDSTRKFRQEPVASVFHGAAAVLRDCRLDSVR